MTATADQQLFSIAAGREEDRHAHHSGATRNCGADSIVEDLLIDVEDGRIVIVARRPTAFIGSPEMLDLGDVTLLPGLIDIHQLLAFDASDDPVAHLFDVNDATLLLRAATICSRHFLCGTTRPAAWCIPCRQYSAELNVYRRALHVHGDGRNRGRTSVAAVPYADERPAGGPQTGSRHSLSLSTLP